MLNSLYGKFATSQDLQSKIPYLREDGIVSYTMSDKTQKTEYIFLWGALLHLMQEKSHKELLSNKNIQS